MNLGSFGVCHAKEGFLANVQPRVHFRSPLPPPHESCWIHAGRRLKVAVNLLFDSVPIEQFGLPKSTVEDLQSSLSHASLWAQLGLEAELPAILFHPPIINTPGSTLVATLQPKEQTSKSGKAAARLLHGMPWNHVRPPEGITSIAMCELELVVDIRSTQEESSESMFEICIQEESSESLFESCMKEESSQSLFESCIQEESSQSLLESCIQECVKDGDDVHMLDLEFLKENDSTVAGEETSCWTMEPKGSSDTFSQRSTKLPSCTILVGLLDAAIRRSIHGNPGRLTEGWKMESRLLSGSRHLSDLAPALWRPGYLQGTAERACYLPKISTIISSYLAARPGGTSDPVASTLQSKNEINGRLWKILTDDLRHRKICKKLQPIQSVGSYSNNLQDNEKHESDEMLLEPQVKAGADEDDMLMSAGDGTMEQIRYAYDYV